MTFITNGLVDKETFAKKLTDYGNNCTEACFVTAFFTQEQLIQIMNSAGKSVRLTVSLRPPTCPKALRKILLFQNVEVRFLGSELHSKIYGFAKGDRNSLFEREYNCAVGSSNMTEGGLYKNIETNVLLTEDHAKQAYEQAEAIFDSANQLTSNVLDRYEEELKDYEKPVFTDITSSPDKLDAGYERINNAIKYVSNLCGVQISQNYSDVPVSFVVDYFWHFIVEIKKNEEATLKRETQNGPNSHLIKELFNEFIEWDLSGDKFSLKMLDLSKNLKKLLSKSSPLDTQEIKDIFLTFHAARYTEERYGDKAQYFIENNTSQEIIKSLRYLADESNPISERITELLEGELKLKGFGESSIKEFNGWYHPDKYPIWNKKSDRALDILGFG